MKSIALLHWTASSFSLKSMGGLEVMEYGLLQKLREKYKTSLFVHSFSNNDEKIKNITHFALLRKYDIFYYLQFIIKNFKTDILIGFNTPILSLISPKKTLVIFQNFIKVGARKTFLPFYALLQKRYHQSRYIFCSDFLRNEFLKQYPNFPEEKATTIFNALSKEKIVIRTDSFPQKKSIVYMGQWNYDKGFDILLDSIQMLRNKRDDFSLFLLGGKNLWGQKKKSFISIPHEEYITNVGILSHEEISKFIKNKDILVVPSRWAEPFGLVALEGMAAGMVVVTSGEGGLSDIIENKKNGIVVKNIDAMKLAEALNEVLDYKKEKINIFRKNSYKKISEKFTWDIYIKKLENLFEKIN